MKICKVWSYDISGKSNESLQLNLEYKKEVKISTDIKGGLRFSENGKELGFIYYKD